MTDEPIAPAPWVVFGQKPGEIMIESVNYFESEDDVNEFLQSKKDETEIIYKVANPGLLDDENNTLNLGSENE